MDIIKPKKIEKGSTIGIIAPSSCLSAIFPHRIHNAIKALKKIGFGVKEFGTIRKVKDWSAGTPEERANDINSAFFDGSVDLILTTIGGNTANQTLEYLNFKKIKKHPKIFCGYSDISIIHYALMKKSNLMGFYGPCAMTQFGEFPKPLDYTIDYFLKAVLKGKKIGRVVPSDRWTDEILDWAKKDDLKRARKLKNNPGFSWLKNGKAKAQIIGGCLSSIIHLIGTPYWPDHKNKILFIEIPEGQDFSKGEPLPNVDSYLTELRIAGIFEKIKGLIVGRPFRYNQNEVEKFKEIILENTKGYDFPICYGVDIGHTDPIITVPLGAEVELDSEEDVFRIHF